MEQLLVATGQRSPVRVGAVLKLLLGVGGLREGLLVLHGGKLLVRTARSSDTPLFFVHSY